MNDDFEIEINTDRAGDKIDGYLVDYKRFFNGLNVEGDKIRFFILILSDLNEKVLLLNQISSNFHRDLEKFFIEPLLPLPFEEALSKAELQAGGKIEVLNSELLIYPFEKNFYLVYRVDGKFQNEMFLFYINGYTGEIINSKKSQVKRTGYIKIKATNPNEVYDPAIGKTYKPLPRVNIYNGYTSPAPFRGNSSKLIGSTDYHGYYNITAGGGDGTYLCSTCWLFDFKYENYGVKYFHDQSPCISSYITILDNILNYPEGAIYYVPWTVDDQNGRRGEIFYHLNYGWYFYKDYYGGNLKNIRFNDIYDELPSPTCNASNNCDANSCSKARCCKLCNQNLDCINPPYQPWCKSFCEGAEMGCSPEYCGISFFCGAYSSSQDWDLYDDHGEIRGRNTIYHEMTHNLDYASRNAFIENSLIDFPRRSGHFTEGFGVFGAGPLSDFQSQYGALNGHDVKYPDDYCTTDPNNPKGPIDSYEGVPLTVIYNDYILYTGVPLGFRRIMWQLSDPDFKDGIRLLDCENVSDISECINPSTFYKILLKYSLGQASSHWQTSFEVSKAFHNRISDANPAINAPNDNQCSFTDPDKDTFPWADDFTNRTYLGSFYHMDFVPSLFLSEYNNYQTPFGEVSNAPDTCYEDPPGTYICRKPALNYYNGNENKDYDKFQFVGKIFNIPQTRYRIETFIDSYNNDTILEIRGPDGTILESNDDCNSNTYPGCNCSLNYPRRSCLTFTPSKYTDKGDIYTIQIYPYPTSNVGANATYKLKVSLIGDKVTSSGDDFGDNISSATPVVGDGIWRVGYINTIIPQDYDYYYIIVPFTSRSNFKYSLCSLDGTFIPYIIVYDKNGNQKIYYEGLNCAVENTTGLNRGTYYIEIGAIGIDGYPGRYMYKFFVSGDIGNNKNTAFNLYDPAFNYPTKLRAVPSTLSDGNDVDVFTFWAKKGEILTAEAITQFGKGVNLRLFTPDNSFYNTASYTKCGSPESPSLRKIKLSSPIYILEDRNGGIARASNELMQNGRFSLVAPKNSYYYVEVSNKGNEPVSYFLYFYPSGYYHPDYPPLP